MHQPAHANGGIGGPGCTRLGAVRPTRSEKSTGPEKHGNSGTGPADPPRTGAEVLAHSLATAARATSSRSTAAMARGGPSQLAPRTGPSASAAGQWPPRPAGKWAPSAACDYGRLTSAAPRSKNRL